MKWKVYILFSEKYRKSYVGFSEDPQNRLIHYHNAGKVASTKKFRPWKIVFEEEFETREEAMSREKHYKTSAGRRKMKIIFKTVNLNSN